MTTFRAYGADGQPFDSEALWVGRHVALNDKTEIVHLATGRRVTLPGASEDLARHLDKKVRWVWLDEQPFGSKPTGRGATMARNAITRAIEEFHS